MRIALRYLLCPLLLIVFITTALGTETLSLQTANELFSRANAAYRAQKYKDAAALYKQLLQADYDSAQVLYNLGTTAARLENYGEALAYLTRAHRLAPRDENIIANLHRVKLDHARKSGLSDEAAAAVAAEKLCGAK